MTRSIRKTPIFANANCHSEKPDKRQAHRVERAKARTSLSASANLDEVLLTARKEAHSNVYLHGKDGKHYSPVRTTFSGRALAVLSVPKWLKSLRDVHRAMGK